MPIRWDDKARFTLLLKLIEHNPTILNSSNADKIAASWPGDTKPTGRAIIEQIKVLKKEVGGPSTPTTKRTTNKLPRTPGTPASTTAKTPSTTGKRSGNSAHTGSPTKRRNLGDGRKKGKRASDDESEEEPMSSSSPDDDDIGNDNDDEETDQEEIVSPTRSKRRLPTRARSRNVTYTAEADSAGEDNGAKESCSDEDETFSLEMLGKEKEKGKGKGKSKLKMSRLGTSAESDEHEEVEVKEDGSGVGKGVTAEGGCDTESDEESEAMTFYTAGDYVV